MPNNIVVMYGINLDPMWKPDLRPEDLLPIQPTLQPGQTLPPNILIAPPDHKACVEREALLQEQIAELEWRLAKATEVQTPAASKRKKKSKHPKHQKQLAKK